MNTNYSPEQDFFRVAAATPEVSVGDVATNTERIASLYLQAQEQEVSLVTFPELSITGYTIGDLVMRRDVLDDAQESLVRLAESTENTNSAMVVGLPIQVGNVLYNSAAMLADGEIQGVVPKIHLPTYKEFYEKRWYAPGQEEVTTLSIKDKETQFGANQLFQIGSAVVGIEVCEDLWVPQQRSIDLVTNGATIVVNPSASPELVTKAEYRKQLVNGTAGRLAAGYVYAGADPSESTMDIVMSGHAIISDQGRQLAERKPFDYGADRLTVADIDIGRIQLQRRSDPNYPNKHAYEVHETAITPRMRETIRVFDASPFVPAGDPETINQRLSEVLDIQAAGLKNRLESSAIKKVVLGLSGGLDSALAFMVALRTAQLIEIDAAKLLHTITMPGEASSARTQNNAVMLAESLGIPNEEIPIGELSTNQLAAIGHDTTTQDTTYENTQARLRTAVLFNTANKKGAIVLGTGDLSEIALGWCTYNGDHMSGYNVNASVPKTLVRSLVAYAAETFLDNTKAQSILHDIIDTPISPELTSTDTDTISQETESVIGPYELHDFFLSQFIRWGDATDKISYIAGKAFAGVYDQQTIDGWLETFMDRFYGNQWKRSVMPDGPKVGPVSLSPRGDWRMPSDARRP